MNLKKIKAFLTLFTLILPLEIKADDYHFLKSNLTSNSIEIYGVKLDGSSNLLNTYTSTNPDTPEYLLSDFSGGLVDQYEGKIYFSHNEYQTNEQGTSISSEHFWLSYDLINNEFEKTSLDNSYIIYPEGIKTMIRKKADGSVHIGENSAVFKEENGVEKFWATDATGKSIPINITNGSKLLINGRDVEQSIDNVGALSAALTGLPTIPTDSPVACGIGTGLHGGNYAFSGGCASNVNEKLSFNAAASFVPGQDYQGVDNSYSARAGFVWQLGESNKPTQISMKAKEKMEVKINSLEDKNKRLENTVSNLVAKLERLEKLALKESKSEDLATIKLQ